MRWRAEVNKHLGGNSELVDRTYLKKAIPLLNLSEDVRYPVLGALYHRPGAILRHDAVAWGYAARAAERGVAVHQKTRVMRYCGQCPLGQVKPPTAWTDGLDSRLL